MARGADDGDDGDDTDGTLADTYVAAIQHDLAELPDGATRVGVVRQPTPWFHGAVDENEPALGPPDELLEAFREREADLKRQGLCAAGAHNAAWDEVEFEAAYRAYLEGAAGAQAALEELRARLADGEALALVCFENTAQKRCHRTILRNVLESESIPVSDT